MASILVVDDLPNNLALIQRYLSDGGHTVRVAGDAEAAYELVARGGRFDLFILDVVLPGMSGFELCQLLRQREDTRDAPVIFVTGERGDLPDLLEGFASGANDFLQKPVDRRELLARVDVMLRLVAALGEARRANERLTRSVAEGTRALERALDRLADNRRLLEDMFDRLPTAVVVFDADRRVVTANAEAHRRFGPVTPGTPLARTPLAPVLGDEEPREGRFRCELGLPDAGTASFEAECQRMDGSEERWLLTLADPGPRERLLAQVRDRELSDLRQRVEELSGELRGRYRIARMVAASPAMQRITDTVDKLRDRWVTVLIRGESGTGKELVARAIHFDGAFSDRPFVPVNCAAIPGELFESELFGHVKGAFTGALRDAPGLIAKAEGGTLFLDEVGELGLDAQTKLLRFLQSGEVRAVGSQETRVRRCRLICATNRDLAAMVADGSFREDLYYRIEGVQVEIPPLRDRPEDLPLLVERLVREVGIETGRRDELHGVSREAMRALEAHDWPGNVRELENVFRRAISLCPGPLIELEDLPATLLGEGRAGPRLAPLRQLVPYPAGEREGFGRRRLDAAAILAAVDACDGIKTEAARRLGISRATLYRKIEEFGLQQRLS
ncbi:MAG: sigma 54-interacting transcriptional regulator [Planctomycetota bacterium]